MYNFLKDITWFKWNPNKDLLAIGVSWILVVTALSFATFIATPQNGILYFILYGIIGAALFGVGIPLAWTVFIRKRKLSTLGITTKHLKKSIAVQVILAILLYGSALAKMTLPAADALIPLAALSLAIGFFEAVFWRGWILQRLEDSFGLIPAIFAGSFLYAVYHIGYGMPSSEMVFLFFIGIMFAVVFRFTGSIFIIWPFFQPLGQLTTLIKDQLALPMIAALGFVEVLAFMIGLCWAAIFIAKRRRMVLAS